MSHQVLRQSVQVLLPAAVNGAAVVSNRCVHTSDPRRELLLLLYLPLPLSLSLCLSYVSLSLSLCTVDNAFGRHFTTKIGQENDSVGDADEDEDEEEDEGQHEADVETLLAGGDSLSLNKFGRNRRFVYV